MLIKGFNKMQWSYFNFVGNSEVKGNLKMHISRKYTSYESSQLQQIDWCSLKKVNIKQLFVDLLSIDWFKLA